MVRDSKPAAIRSRSYLTKPRIKTALLLLSVVACTGAQAEVYKWTDSQGGVHYSGQPPAGIKYETVSPHYAAPANPPAAEPKVEPQNDQKKTEQEKLQKEQQNKEEVARIRQHNCEVAQKRLASLESFPRIRVRNPDGTVDRLSEDERQAQIAEAQGLINQYCN